MSSDRLYKEWIVSGAHPADFLLNHKHATNVDIGEWKWQLRMEAKEPRHFATLEALDRPPTGVAPTVNEVTRVENVGELIRDWRAMQCKADHSSAEAVRARILEFVESSSGLTASELRSLAGALAEVQKIQRLALGLSTENTGVQVSEARGLKVKFVGAVEDDF